MFDWETAEARISGSRTQPNAVFLRAQDWKRRPRALSAACSLPGNAFGSWLDLHCARIFLIATNGLHRNLWQKAIAWGRPEPGAA